MDDNIRTIELLNIWAQVPAYQTELASGMDLHSSNIDTILLRSGERALIPTGIAIHLKEGEEAQVRSRSGLAHKHGVVVLNSPGTIDADYQGEIKVILFNHGTEDFEITRGLRIAQLVISDVKRITPRVVKLNGEVKRSERGDKGFGSTGL